MNLKPFDLFLAEKTFFFFLTQRYDLWKVTSHEKRSISCFKLKLYVRGNVLFAFSDTSRVPREDEQSGKNYHFTTRQEMEVDIRAGMYLENGDFEGNLYGTKVDSIRDVMRSGKMCILDVNPTVSSSFW